MSGNLTGGSPVSGSPSSPTPLWTGQAVLGAIQGKGPQNWRAKGVSIDSRTLQPGDLFFALRGPRMNGHDYVGIALEKGAAAAVVSEEPRSLPSSSKAPLIWVEDGAHALWNLGKAARSRSQAQKIIAVTGSVGKTGVKEALHHLLSSQGPTSSSALSYNNELGVPLSLCRLPEEATYGVFEIGMNHPGEIAPLARLVCPHVAVITTVAGAHRAFFTSMAEIAETKAEIFQGLLPGGVSILNRDNPYFDLLLKRARDRDISVLSFGQSPHADVRALSYALLEKGSQVQASVLGAAFSYFLPHPGVHWVENSLALLATLVALEVPLERVILQLSNLPPLKGRGLQHLLHLQGKTITLIDESYNANPASMEAAIHVLGKTTPPGKTNRPPKGRRIAVLGDMGELGEEAQAHHYALKPLLEKNEVDLVVTCGPLMESLYRILSPTQKSAHLTCASEVTSHLQKILREGDVVMLKASRRIGFEQVVQALVQNNCQLMPL